jgi:serine/threonine protein kinase
MAAGPGTLLKGKYRIVERLGGGGMRMVWRGEDIGLNREVAIKVLREQEAGTETYERFRHEAELAARLDHPGITAVYDFGQHEDTFFIVMPLLKGQDFKAILRENPVGLPPARVKSYGVQVAEALAVAHKAGVIHRDIKPASLFLLAGDRVMICDFGIAHGAGASAAALTQPGTIVGTPAYMAPEQWSGEQADERTDLYSFGCVLYELLTGRPPFAPEQALPALMGQHLEIIPKPARGAMHEIPHPLGDLVRRLLAKDPAARPQTARAVADELAEILLAPAGEQRTLARPFQPGQLKPFQPGYARYPGRLSVTSQHPSGNGNGHNGNGHNGNGHNGDNRRHPANAGQPPEAVSPGAGDVPAAARKRASRKGERASRHKVADPVLARKQRPVTVGLRTAAWVLFLTTATMTGGTAFGWDPVIWLWWLVPAMVFSFFTALISMATAFERRGPAIGGLVTTAISELAVLLVAFGAVPPVAGILAGLACWIAAFFVTAAAPYAS